MAMVRRDGKLVLRTIDEICTVGQLEPKVVRYSANSLIPKPQRFVRFLQRTTTIPATYPTNVLLAALN
eukprot:3133009-Amphidinium_carterae.1